MAQGILLFDLDGTILNTAPDLCAAANFLRSGKGLAPLPYEELRPYAGTGAKGLLRAALGITPEDSRYGALREEFLSWYKNHMADNSLPFEGILEALASIHEAGFFWGIVTNKATRLAKPLVEKLFSEAPTPACLIAGDTTPKMKPNPEPLLEALRRVGIAQNRAIYFGDEARDVTAANAAGIASVAVSWGYGAPTADWNYTATVTETKEILPLAKKLLL